MKTFFTRFYILFFLTMIFPAHISFAQETIARITKLTGDVKIKKITDPTFTSVSPGYAVSSGDVMNVGKDSYCMVIFIDDKSVLKIREDTQFQFMDTKNTRTIDIEFGKILHDVKKEKTKDFRVETPVSVASVKGTEFWSVINQMGFDKFYGLEGVVEVFNEISGQSVSLGAGEMTLSTASGQVLTSPADPEEVPEDPEQEVEDIDEEPESIEEETPEEIIEEPAETLFEEDPIEQLEETLEQPEESADEIIEEEVEEQEVEEEPIDESQTDTPKPFDMGLGIGSVTIDDQIYNQLAFRPELNFGKLGIGLDLVFYVDQDGNIRKDEWDETSDLIDKFLFIRYGEKSDPFWLKIGSLENVTLGYGGLISSYSNMMEFPSIRRVGFNGGNNFGSFGTEIFMSNIKDFSRGGTLLGLRGTYKVSESLPITIGINYVSDSNQFSGLKDRDGDSYPDIFDDFPDSSNIWNDSDKDGIPDPHANLDSSRWDIDADGDNIFDELDDSLFLRPTPFSIEENKSKASGFSLDIGYPIINSDRLSLILYSEYNTLSFPSVATDQFNRIERKGSGITVPGMRASLFGFINLSLEYRIKNNYYIPQFFDQAYDLNRVVPVYSNNNTSVFTKDMLVFSDSSSSINSSGYYGSIGFDLLNLASFNASYANMVADTTKFRSFSSMLIINAENIPKLSEARAFYQRNNDINPFDFENPSINTVLGYRVGYEVAPGVSLVWDYRQFYRDLGTGLEPVEQTTIETVFNF